MENGSCRSKYAIELRELLGDSRQEWEASVNNGLLLGIDSGRRRLCRMRMICGGWWPLAILAKNVKEY